MVERWVVELRGLDSSTLLLGALVCWLLTAACSGDFDIASWAADLRASWKSTGMGLWVDEEAGPHVREPPSPTFSFP